MRRTIGTILCLIYGFTIPLLAVVTWVLWYEQRAQFDKLQAEVRFVAREFGLPEGLDLMVLGPGAVVFVFLIIWFAAGPGTRRSTSMIVGLYCFAAIFLGLVLIGQR